MINIETVVIRFGTDHFIFYLHWNTARTCAARTAPVPAAYPILNVEYPGSRSSSIQLLGFVSRFAAVYGFGKPGKSAAAAAVTLTTQGEMCTTKTKKLGVYVLE